MSRDPDLLKLGQIQLMFNNIDKSSIFENNFIEF